MPKCRLCHQEKQIDQITLTHPKTKEHTCHFCIKHVPRKSKKKKRDKYSWSADNEPPSVTLEVLRDRVLNRTRQHRALQEVDQDILEQPLAAIPEGRTEGRTLVHTPRRSIPSLHSTLCNCRQCQTHLGL